MKNLYHILCLTAMLAASCSTQEIDPMYSRTDSEELFFAQMEKTSGWESKAYVDEQLRVLWDENDHVTIFNKNTAGLEYRFTGQTGDNAGTFEKVGTGNTSAGNALGLVYAVYPYREGTSVDNNGTLSISLPSQQTYRKGSFGIGDNTMVSCTTGNRLLFKNLCGYLMLKLYGDNVSVSTISLRGNNGEPLAGTAAVKATVDGSPVLTMGSDATNEISLTFDAPVTIGTSAETATVFWVVVPPTSFKNGITVTVKDDRGGIFEKTTTNSLGISRNKLATMSALEVQPENQADMSLYYTSTNGKIVTPNVSDVFGANIVSNEYVNGVGILTFDGVVLSIGNRAFEKCGTLASIDIPECVTSIGESALADCTGLTSITSSSAIPPTGASDMFSNTNDCPIYVPIGSVDAYKEAPFWSDYADRIIERGTSVKQYMKQTKGNKPVVLCVISEGFQEDELGLFQRLAAEGIDYLFATEPFKTYKDYFSVYFLSIPSQDSGASITDGNGTIITQKNTAFNVRWGANSYSDLEADDNTVYEFVTHHCPEIVNGSLSIQEVPIAMIINDTRYGGMCRSYSDGRGYAMIPYIDSGGQLMWQINNTIANQDEPISEGETYYVRQLTSSELNAIGTSVGSWKNCFLHEFGGHCFSRFKDEYWQALYYTSQSMILEHYYQVPFGLNVSGYYDSTPWDSLLEIRDQLTAIDSNYARIGRFQGADNSLFNRWRSEMISCMIDNRPYFSTWQRILVVKRIMDKAGMEFSADEFFDKDVTIDPVRDRTSGFVMGYDSTRPIREVPLLPPPVLINVN